MAPATVMSDLTCEFYEWVQLKRSSSTYTAHTLEEDGLRHRKQNREPPSGAADSRCRVDSEGADKGASFELFSDLELRMAFTRLLKGACELYELEKTLERLLGAGVPAYLGLLPARSKLLAHSTLEPANEGLETFEFRAVSLMDASNEVEPTQSISIQTLQPMDDSQRTEFDLFVSVMVKFGLSCINRIKLTAQLFEQQSTTAKVAIVKRFGSSKGNFRRQLVSFIGGGGPGGSEPTQLYAQQLDKQIAVCRIHIESMQWLLERKLMRISEFHRELKEKVLEKYVYSSSGASGVHVSNTKGGSLPESGANGSLTGDLEQVQSLVPTQKELLLLEQESNEMVEQLEDSLSLVRTATNMINDIATLHGQMAQHLSVQSATIEQLYNEAFSTTDNVRKANESLRSAGRHYSDSRKWTLIFFIAMTLLLLIIDRIIP